MILLETQRSVLASPTSSASTTEKQDYYYRLARLLTEGWDGKPVKADLSLEPNLVRIKLIRNEIAHMPSTDISESDFLTIRKELRNALKALGLDEGELDRLEADPFNEEFENVKTRLVEIKWKMDQVIEHQEHQKTFTCVGKLVD